MSDDLNGLRASLKEVAADFRPELHTEGLVEAGRRNHRRHQLVIGLSGAGVVALAIALVLPSVWASPAVVPALPAPAATSASPRTSASGSVPKPTPTQPARMHPVIAGTVSTAGWTTFDSNQYPITFKYPSTWRIEAENGDGCLDAHCVTFVNPPKGVKAASLELIRNDFARTPLVLTHIEDFSGVEVLGALPGVAAWSDRLEATETQALVVHEPGSGKEPDEYRLLAADLVSRELSVGGSSIWPERPERVFSFSTNVGNLGGTFDDAGRKTVIAVLASARPNPAFAPTRDPAAPTYRTLPKPIPGSAEPDGTWKTLSSDRANLSLRYPPSWRLREFSSSAILIAPGGYAIEMAVDPARRCDSGGMQPADRIVAAKVEATTDSLGSGPVEIWWQNGGEFPPWVGLVRRNADAGCYQRYLNFGGDDVFVGSIDNGMDLTKAELDEAIAILASATRLG